jgi:hypothetical protein
VINDYLFNLGKEIYLKKGKKKCYSYQKKKITIFMNALKISDYAMCSVLCTLMKELDVYYKWIFKFPSSNTFITLL